MIQQPLNGVRVLEQGTFITGPCSAMTLADLGADVIKVEAPEIGDPYRNFRGGLYSAHFQAYNRGKRSICLNLKEPPDAEVFKQLVSEADIYIQNFRPGAASRMGADYETLKAINPRLVYVSISGFGQDGPYAHRPSYDSVTQALSGFLGVATDPRNPRLLGPAMADAMTGIYAAMGAMAALIERGRTGKGKLLEISMLEAMMHFAVEPFTGFFALGDIPTALDRPRLAQAFILTCKDGRHLGVHLSSMDKFWEALVGALDAQALAADPRFAVRPKRIDNYEELLVELNKITTTKTRPEWLERFSGFDLPYAPLNNIEEAANDIQARHLGMIVPVEGRIEGAKEAVRTPFTFDHQRATSSRAAPLVGQHSDEIRTALQRAPGVWPERQAAKTAEPA
jgi:crotonobetainyl-CoA:carnitine CoA-transferase CaiB-like acyl-CoA transferase